MNEDRLVHRKKAPCVALNDTVDSLLQCIRDSGQCQWQRSRQCRTPPRSPGKGCLLRVSSDWCM